MAPFLTSSFGSVFMTLFQGTLSTPSWHSFTSVASGWSLAWGRQTIPTSLGVSGAASVTHFSRSYACLGGPLYRAHARLWAQVIRRGASCIDADDVIRRHGDDHIATKAGRHLQGRARYRHGAGSARQAYRILAGINLVLCTMRMLLKVWPGPALSLPSGVARYLKSDRARQLGGPYRSRSQWARCMVDVAASHLPPRRLRVSGDGACATKAF